MPGLVDIELDESSVELPTRGGGEPLRIYYRPGAVTPRQVHQQLRWAALSLADLPEAEQREALDSTQRTLAALVTRWNLDDAQGHPIPPTLEGLEDVTYAHQRLFLDAILGHTRTPKLAALGESSVDNIPADRVVDATVSSAASSTPAPSALPQAPSPLPSLSGTATTPSPSGFASASSSFPTFPITGSPEPL